MTLADAKTLKVGDRVLWTDPDYPNTGEVIAADHASLKVLFADSVVGLLLFAWGDGCDYLRSLERQPQTTE